MTTRAPGSRVIDAVLIGGLRLLLAYRWLQSLLPTGGKRRKALAGLTSPDPVQRRSAALQLGQLTHPEAIPALIFALDDTDLEVRQHAGWALTEIGPPALPAILSALPSGSAVARVRLLKALGVIDGGAGAAAAVAALSDADRDVRVAAAEVLELAAEPPAVGRAAAPVDRPRHAGDEVAATDLIRGLAAQEPEVRRASAMALADLRHAPAAGALLGLMTDKEENADIRGAAAIALGRIGDPRHVNQILPLLEDEELESYASEALRGMGRGLAEVLAQLDAPGGKRGSRQARIKAVRALGALGDAGGAAALLKTAADPDPEVRAETVSALEALVRQVDRRKSAEPGDRARLRAAIGGVYAHLFTDPDAVVRARAVSASAALGPVAASRLAPLMRDPDPGVRQNACRALGAFHGREALDALAAALRDEDEFVRLAAIDALKVIDDSRVLPLLIDSLGDPAIRVRQNAVYALAPTGRPWAAKHMPAVRAALVRALGDAAKEVRHGAADAFRRLDDVDAVDALIAALGDPESWVRQQVVETLGSLRRKRALAALRAVAADDPELHVRRAAASAVDVLTRSGR